MLQWNFLYKPWNKKKTHYHRLDNFQISISAIKRKRSATLLACNTSKKKDERKKINVNIKRGLTFFRRVIGNLLSKLALCRLRTLIEIPWTTNPINDSDIHSNQALLKHLWRLQPLRYTLLDIVAALLCCILRKINRDGGKMFWLMCQWCFDSLND